MTRGLLLCATVLALAGPVRAQLSPRLRMAARGQLPAPVSVTVRLPGGAARLRALGLSARALSPTVATAALPRDALAWLAASEDRPVVEERRVLHPLLDRAAAAVGATAARAATGRTGRGVLVGVVDSGIDLRHADFRDDAGRTRIAAILDLGAPPDDRHPESAGYGGAIWDRDEIDALLAAEAAGVTPAVAVTERDVDGHGTHVASIAAGGGLATGRGFPAGRYVGIAPGAELVVAQTGAADGITDVSVLAACRFMIDRARSLGRPIAVNVSLGADGGPHDGTTNFEAALDELFPADAPGRAVVVAAGNGGGQDRHAGGWALDGEAIVPFALAAGDGASASIELWYRGDVAIAVESPAGRRTPLADAGGSVDVALDGEARVTIDNAGAPAASGRRDAGLVISAPSDRAAPAAGRWRLVVSGRAIRWDAWVAAAPRPGNLAFTDRVVPDDQLSIPATAKNAIAVGATVSRLDWATVDDRAFVVPTADPILLGEVAFFSSAGPTADGRFVPDVAAPGEYTIGALSQDATPDHAASVFHTDGDDPHLLWADDGVHGVLRGTSQAAPIVTGALALLFEAAPTLSASAAREVLRATAAPVPDGAGWSPRSGFGRLDVGRALAFVAGERGQAPSASASRVGLLRDQLPPDSDETTLVTVTPCDALGRPLGRGRRVSIALSAGAPVGGVVERGDGRYERAFVAHAPRGAVGEVAVTVDGVPLDAHPRVAFVPSRAEIGGALVAGGGCSAAGAAAPVGPCVLWLALLLLPMAGRRRLF